MSNPSTPDATHRLDQRVGTPYFFTPEHYERMRALESDGWWNSAMRDVTEMLLRQARLPRRGMMLDVGCSSGHTMIWFDRLHPQWQTAGLDGSPDHLRAARSLNLAVSRGSALALPHPDGCADLVFALDVVQRLQRGAGDLGVMREMRRVLKPGGVLFLRSAAEGSGHAFGDAEPKGTHDEPDDLRSKLERSGFAVLRLSRIHASARAPRGSGASRSASREWVRALKRRWLKLEGRMICAGVPVPFGRAIVALCRAA